MIKFPFKIVKRNYISDMEAEIDYLEILVLSLRSKLEKAEKVKKDNKKVKKK